MIEALVMLLIAAIIAALRCNRLIKSVRLRSTIELIFFPIVFVSVCVFTVQLKGSFRVHNKNCTSTLFDCVARTATFTSLI